MSTPGFVFKNTLKKSITQQFSDLMYLGAYRCLLCWRTGNEAYGPVEREITQVTWNRRPSLLWSKVTSWTECEGSYICPMKKIVFCAVCVLHYGILIATPHVGMLPYYILLYRCGKKQFNIILMSYQSRLQDNYIDNSKNKKQEKYHNFFEQKFWIGKDLINYFMTLSKV